MKTVSFLRLLCSHKYYTESGTRTIDSGRGGIFQHRNTFDIFGIQHIDIPRNIIYQHQRTTAIDGSRTTNIEWFALSRTGSIIIRSNLKSRHRTLQSTHGIDNRTAPQYIIHLYLRYRAGQVRFLLYAKTNYYHFVQTLCVLFQHYRQRLSWSYFQGLSLITNIRDFKNGFFWTDIQDKITVHISDRTIGGAFFYHTGTDYRFTCRIHHSSAHFYLFLMRLFDRCQLRGQNDLFIYYLIFYIRIFKYFVKNFKDIITVSGDCHQPFQIYMSIVVEETKFCLLLYRS